VTFSRTIIRTLSICALSLACFNASAQTESLTQARYYADQKNYGKAAETYKQLYEQMPLDAEIYQEYLSVLLADKNYKEAEKLVERQLKVKPYDQMLLVDLGKVYRAAGKDRKAEEQFEKAVHALNGDDLLTTKMANTFSEMKEDKWAIRTYEHATELLRNPFIYGNPLAKLYARAGEIEKAVNALLNIGPVHMPGVEDTKVTLLELVSANAKTIQLAQKALIKRINEQPENSWFSEILTWLYTQKNDWEGALIQIQALDERNKEGGQRLLEFARNATREKQYDIAVKALDAVTETGKENPLYAVAKAERMNVLMAQLQDNPKFTPEDVTRLSREYEQFFTEFPQYYNTETLRDYAMLEAQYAGNPGKAIALLEKAIAQPAARKEFAGWAKLQLGDYYILAGKIWDASLIYSQVDKAFREDLLGEEARFRNAKLAYYRNDFEWAQGQLSVLKASTSELIANDALYLSVLITENIPPDSNMVPLNRFAYADLLLFQNKDKEAEALLDSIAQAFPKHPLNDDILMLRSRLAVKHRDYNKALDYLKQVYDACKNCGKDDLLRDDALFRTAELYDTILKNPEEAKKFYELLIVDYPGSTYVQTARVKLAALKGEGNALP